MTELQPIYDTALTVATGAGEWERAANDWLANLKAERTRRAYLNAWRGFLAYAELHPRDVTRGAVIAYRNNLKSRGYAPATISLHLSAISSFYRHAVEADLIASNPVSGVKWPGVEPSSDT